jgi:hypothetical protein
MHKRANVNPVLGTNSTFGLRLRMRIRKIVGDDMRASATEMCRTEVDRTPDEVGGVDGRPWVMWKVPTPPRPCSHVAREERRTLR